MKYIGKKYEKVFVNIKLQANWLQIKAALPTFLSTLL